MRPVEIRKGAIDAPQPPQHGLIIAARPGPVEASLHPAHPPKLKAHPDEARQRRHRHRLGDGRNDAHQPAIM